MVGFKNSISLPSILTRSGFLLGQLFLLVLPLQGQSFIQFPDTTDHPRFNWEDPQRSARRLSIDIPKSYTELKNLPSVIKPQDFKVGDWSWTFHPIQGTARIRYEIMPLPFQDFSFGFSKTQQVYQNGQNLLRPRFLRSFFEFSETERTEFFFLWQVKNLEILTTLQTSSLIGSAEPRFNPQKETLTIRLTYRF